MYGFGITGTITFCSSCTCLEESGGAGGHGAVLEQRVCIYFYCKYAACIKYTPRYAFTGHMDVPLNCQMCRANARCLTPCNAGVFENDRP